MALWHDLSFREPMWLWLALQPLVILLAARLIQARTTSQYSEAHLSPWVQSQTSSTSRWSYLRLAFLQLAWLSLSIAIAGPRLPSSLIDTSDHAQRQVMVLVDVSPSMAARDILPNRLERSKLELLDLIQRMQATRMGIIVYGARPHLLSPLSHDKAVLRHYVSTIKTQMLPTQGSRLNQALHYAAEQLAQEINTPRAILLMTDGENHLDQGQSPSVIDNTLQQLKQAGIQIYILGIGTSYGAPILAGDSGWLEDEGQTVNSRLRSEPLQRLAQLGNGIYSELHDGNFDWQRLYDNGIGQLRPVKQTLQSERIVWQELYQGFVLMALLCFVLALGRTGIHKTINSLLMFGLLYTGTGMTNDSYAGTVDYKTAYRHLADKNYQQARQAFAGLAGYAARLGEGTAAYRLQDYKAAAQQYTQAILDSSNDMQRAHALFNLANCQYQLADYFTAADGYADVLRYLPDHAAAKINLAYAQALQQQTGQTTRTARRAGRGPATGRLLEGEDISSGKLTLGDDDEQIFIPPESNTMERKTPLRQTLYDAQPASRRVDTAHDRDWDYAIHSLDQLRQARQSLTHNEALLWQRMYELEEGFLAPVEKAHVLPGVKPW